MKSEKNKMTLDFSWEKSLGCDRVAGIDEVGYGAWAGPIVVAAVVIAWEDMPLDAFHDVRDSKALSPRQREEIVKRFEKNPAVSKHLVWITAEEIQASSMNVLQLTLRAGAQAVESLGAQGIVMDGKHKIPLSLPQYCAPKGDQKSLSIALASIFAKVARDREMVRLHAHYPFYDWEKNKGYGTSAHEAALVTHGLTVHHRKHYCQKALARHGLS